MKLYYRPGACSMACHIALVESGLKFKTELVDFDKTDFTSVNPKGYVPVLELDNGEILTEGSVILQYIADQVPAKNLVPKAGTMERYRCQEWLNYAASELHKSFMPLFMDDTPADIEKATRVSLTKKIEFVDKSLTPGKHDFLLGKTYSVADSYLYTILTWCHHVEIDLSKYHGIMGFMERVKSRPGTHTAMKEEGLIK